MIIYKSRHPLSCAEHYLKQLRKVEKIKTRYDNSTGISRKLWKLAYLFMQERLYKIGKETNLDIGLHSCGDGVKIWHTAGGVVINENARIGRNLTLHGCNCIGNDGIHPAIAPRIGNNVHLGFGASVIGDVTLADNIWVAAGAVVVTSFNEPGIVIGGIPARKIKNIQ